MVSVGLVQSVEGLLKRKRTEVPQEEGFPAAGLGLWTESQHPLFPAGLPAEFARQPHSRASRFPNVNLSPSAQAIGLLSPESPDQYHCLLTLPEQSGLCSGGCRGPAAPRPQSCSGQGPGLLPFVLALRAERGGAAGPWLASSRGWQAWCCPFSLWKQHLRGPCWPWGQAPGSLHVDWPSPAPPLWTAGRAKASSRGAGARAPPGPRPWLGLSPPLCSPGWMRVSTAWGR